MLNAELSSDTAIPLLSLLPQRIENKYLNKYIFAHVYSRTIHNTPQKETALMGKEWKKIP